MRIAQTRKLHAAGILPKPSPTIELTALAERLEALRLVFASKSLEELVRQSVKEDWDAVRFLDALLRLELERQEERRVAQAIKISHLPTGPTISNFDFAFQPSVSRSQIQTLGTGQWIRDGHSLLLQGPPGVGKSHLSIGLGLSAIESGFSVSFYRLDELMHQLKRDGELEPSKLKYRKYMASNLVIIDEFGYKSLDREEANLFFRVVNYRYTNGRSLAITTNKGIGSWPEMLAGDEVLAGAILDRLLHCATVLNIQGRSYRLKELDEKLSQAGQGMERQSSGSGSPKPGSGSLSPESDSASSGSLETESGTLGFLGNLQGNQALK
jgi:DNA replication protein DnaC